MIELDVEAPLARFALRASIKTDAASIAVLGPSGSGKSSLLETIAGLRRGARGRIVVGGAVLLDSARGVELAPEARRVGWVPQDVALFPHLDVAANIAFGARGAPLRMREAIEILELGPLLRRDPATLSGGEKQRVGLARALASDPRVLLFDEPLAAVDVAHRARIVPWLLRARPPSVPLLYVTHDLGEAAALATHALVLRDGRATETSAIGDAIAAAYRAVPDLALQNHLVGEVREAATLTLASGATLAVPRGDALGGAVYTLAAEEIILALERPTAISARNVIEATVRAIAALDDDAIVELDALGTTLRAKVTDRAVEHLALARDRRVFLVIKTHALRRA